MSASTATTTALTSTPDLNGLAVFGKVVFALLVVFAFIFIGTWIVRRLNTKGGLSGRYLKIIDTKAIGPKERIVIVAVNDETWLVLGVTASSVRTLHEMPAQPRMPDSGTATKSHFGQRFTQALKQNLRQQGKK